jgi:hypothetical protein
MDGENPPNCILVNGCSESQIDLLGDLGTSPGRIALFHLHDGVDQVCRWAFGAWLCSLLWREQQSVLSLNQAETDSMVFLSSTECGWRLAAALRVIIGSYFRQALCSGESWEYDTKTIGRPVRFTSPSAISRA